MHTYDAQITAGAPQPLPVEVALDGAEELLNTCNSGPYAWPHKPCAVDYHATEGRSWRLSLTPDGVWSTRLPADGAADASIRGTAGELVLAFYGRVPVGALEVGGDAHIFDQLIEWDPDA